MYWKLAVFVASLPTVDQARISRRLANVVIIFGSCRILVQALMRDKGSTAEL